jgi:hypothetical protein
MNKDKEQPKEEKPHPSQDDADRLAQELENSTQQLCDEAFDVVKNDPQGPNL